MMGRYNVLQSVFVLICKYIFNFFWRELVYSTPSFFNPKLQHIVTLLLFLFRRFKSSVLKQLYTTNVQAEIMRLLGTILSDRSIHIWCSTV